VPRGNANWIDVGATNRWKPFDGSVTSKVEKTTSISYVIDVTGRADSIAVLNSIGSSSVDILVEDPAQSFADIYTQTYALNTRFGYVPRDIFWHNYFFTPIISKQAFADFDLPATQNPRVTITLSGTTGNTLQIGAIVVGRSTTIGTTQYNPSFSIADYSVKNKNDQGEISIVERPYADRADYTISLANSGVDGVKQILTKLRATSAVYVGSTLFDASITFGFYNDFSVQIPGPSHSVCTITVEGLS
jgi:hypothetical protein